MDIDGIGDSSNPSTLGTTPCSATGSVNLDDDDSPFNEGLHELPRPPGRKVAKNMRRKKTVDQLEACPKNDLERKEMENISYATTVGSLKYTMVCTRPDIAFAVGMLGRYQSDLDYANAVTWKKDSVSIVTMEGFDTTFYCLVDAGGVTFELSGYTKMGSIHRSGVPKKSNDSARLIITTIMGVVFGFFVGISFPSVLVPKLNLPSSLLSSIDVAIIDESRSITSKSFEARGSGDIPKIYVPTNPRGAELLPPGIVVSESDFYLRRLWGDPNEDLKTKPKYLVTFTVGFDQRNNINAAVKKFSEDFTILLFHYDGRTSEWDQFEWSKRAIHVSVKKQTKWWYAKRFLHPDVVAAYDYIFIWDEDLGVEHFNSEKYIQLVKKHGLEISQPGLEPNKGLTWQMTKRRGDSEVHNFVEIMAPVFSREAWHCVWHMIQNDLVHGWGLDFALRRCVDPAYEKIGVVDSQWVIHQVIPSLGNQVRERCRSEWAQFRTRLANADKAYLAQSGKG
ncbi:hypothetical protein HHK36_016621 [Tetracentron sinense]|uniref:Uncharacterized protein n=1 Tax=Tetracentron sinense TaxID=13715 RepID=A0A835DEU8_TETSI|nr:hypothetical protein HHK36_016621 [Tetracentron sinense]